MDKKAKSKKQKAKIKEIKKKKASSRQKPVTRKKTSPTKQDALKKKSSKKTSSINSMEELLAQTGHKIKTLKKGDRVKAKITDKAKRVVFFDVGVKTEGILASREREYIGDFLKTLKIGDEVKARVVLPENEKGQILLSLREAASDWKWGLFEEFLKSGEAVEVRGLDATRGGMIARFMDMRGFIPTSQFGRQHLGKLKNLYNKLFKVKIIEVDREKNRLIFSEKQVSEAEMLKKQEEALSKIKVGETYEGVISGVMSFGLFVRVAVGNAQQSIKKKIEKKKKKEKADDKKETKKEKERKKDLYLEGLVHISEISWEKVDNLPKLYKTGQKVKVKVIGVEEGTGKLTLSIKRLKPDPWEELVKDFKKGAKVKGKITKLAGFGAFVKLKAGVEGLIHISKIPADRDMKVGDEVEVYVESLDKKQRRISLGLVLKEKPVGYK